MKESILVYGWFGHNNVGDELFKEAFEKLFPDYTFKFVDSLTLEIIERYDIIFFGGGSFLNQEISIPENKNEVWKQLLRKKILYIGVGLETNLHEDHNELIQYSRLVATRTKNNWLNSSHYNVIEIPDLVYALKNSKDISKFSDLNSVLILPNVSVVPTHNDPHWMHSSWDHFKTEMAQFLDYLIDNKYSVLFGNMCKDNKLDDNFATYSILSSMVNRNSDCVNNFVDQKLISMCGMVITQRYHGIVLSDMMNVSCLSIYHHDKLKSDNSISYYELSKDKLISSFNSVKSKESKKNIDINAFNQLIQKVNDIIKE